MDEGDFLEQEATKKVNFLHVILTLLICTFVLIFSANIAPQYYLSQTNKTSFVLADLINFFGKNTYFALQLIPFSLSLISLILCCKFLHHESFKSIFTTRKKFDLKRFFLSFFCWFIILALALSFHLTQTNSQIKWNFSPSFFPLLSFSIILVTLQTVFEEVLFRSYLLKKIHSSVGNSLLAIFSSACLFGLMHWNNPEIDLVGKWILIYFIGTGVFLGIMTVLDKGLELPIGFHAANNLFATLILTNDWQVFQTDALYKDFAPAELGINACINLLGIFPLLLFLYGKIYKWDFGLIIANFTKKTKP